MSELPLIRIEIQEMKHTITSHLNTYHKQVSEAVEKEIETAIEEYDFVGEVQKIVHNVMTSKIDNYFKYGAGNKLISEVIGKTLEDSLHNIFGAKEKI